MPNTELIRKVVARIQARQKEWNQQVWAGIDEENEEDYEAARQKLEKAMFRRVDNDGGVRFVISDAIVPEGVCGTKFCFAGHTVLEAGDAIIMDPQDLDYTNSVLTATGEYRVLEDRARELLGLTTVQSDRLFDGEAGGGNWEAYKRMVTAVTEVDLSDI